VQQFDQEAGGYVPKTSGNELIQSIGNEVNLEKIELIEFSMIDSRAVDLNFLRNLAELVQQKIDHEYVDGIVIVHGTDTMEITAYFLHRTVLSPSKPIVITGKFSKNKIKLFNANENMFIQILGAMRVVTNSDYDGNRVIDSLI
jgi:L-asparaginase/Glu-tRNA(Gln) amidotransferase subunit D